MLSLTSRITIARNARLWTTIRVCQHATIATTARGCDALPLSDAQRRTIYALSTPPGKSGVALIRVSGPEALSVWQRMVHSTRGARDKGDQGRANTKLSPRLPEPWKLQRCHILDPHSSDILDEALAVFFHGAPGTSQKSSPLFR
jgi:tRNA modification GTPase